MMMNDDYDGVEAVQRNHGRNGGGICRNSNKRKAITKMVESNLVQTQKRKAASAYLPDELIIFNILTRLPANSLSRFNCVSKSWCATTVDGQDPKFIAAHSIESNRKPPLVLGFFHVHEKGEEDKQKKKKQAQPSSYYNFISIDQNFEYKFSNYLCFRSAKRAAIAKSYVVGYCNGLFCIRSSSGFEITNLSTRQVLLLPPPPPLPQALLQIKRYGFGFDPLNTEYKIMQFVDGRRCLVFTLGAGGTNLSWREIPVSTEVSNRLNYGYSHPRGTTFCTDPNNAIYSTGCLHWLLIYPHVTVLSFDVHTEQFLLIPAPKKFPEFAERYFLLVFRDRPCCGFLKGFQKRGCGFLKGSRQLGVSYQINLFCLSNDPFTHPVSPYEPKWEEQTIPIPRVFQPKTTLIGLTSHLDQFVVYYYDKVKLIMFYHPHTKHHTFVIFPPTFVAFPPGMRSDLLPEPMFIYHTENLISLKPFLSSGTGADQLGYANQELITGV